MTATLYACLGGLHPIPASQNAARRVNGDISSTGVLRGKTQYEWYVTGFLVMIRLKTGSLVTDSGYLIWDDEYHCD